MKKKLRVILKDLLIRLLAQVTCKYKVTILIYFSINILSSQHSQHDSVVNTISIIDR